MASLSNYGTGDVERWRITFVDADEGKQKCIRLGDISHSRALIIKQHVEDMIDAGKYGHALSGSAMAWLATLKPWLRKKIEAAGLIAPENRMTLWRFLDERIAKRSDILNSTRENHLLVINHLKAVFREDKLLSDVSKADAVAFRECITTQRLASETKKKRLSVARQFFEYAVNHELIGRNPFTGLSLPCGDATKKQVWVPRESVDELMRHAAPAFRLMLVLARFQGLRAPSEVCSLRWDMIDFENDTMTIESPKTKRHAGKGRRTMPLFPEVKLILEKAVRVDEFVVGRKYYDRVKNSGGNWKAAVYVSHYLTILFKKAGVTPWRRPWQNLRSSLVTELRRQNIRADLVSKWLGHSEEVEAKHYVQTSREANPDAWRIALSGAHIVADKDDTKNSTPGGSGTSTGAQKTSQHGSAPNSTNAHAVGASLYSVNTYSNSCDGLPNGTGVQCEQFTTQGRRCYRARRSQED